MQVEKSNEELLKEISILKSQNTKLKNQLKKVKSDRILVEKQVKQSEQIYKSLIDNADVGILVTQDGYFKFANPKLQEFSGYSIEELLTISIFDFIYFEDVEFVKNNNVRRLNSEIDTIKYNFRIVKKDRTISWVEISGVYIEWEGKPATLNFVSDINDRKNTENKLIESQEKLRRIIESSPDGITICRTDGTITFCNYNAIQIWGYNSKDEIIGKNALDFVEISFKSHALILLSELLQNGTIKEAEFVMSKKNGELFFCEIFASLIHDANNQIDGIIFIQRDISYRKKTEEKLKESESRYRLIIESANEGILVAQDANLKFVNNMILEITGYSKEELLSIPFLSFIHPDYRQLMIINYTKRMLGEKIDPRYQIQIICKDKSYKWIELNGVKIEWEGKAAIMNFVSDVSLIKNAEDTLRESENKFRTLFEAAPDAIFLADPETGLIIDANNAACKLIKKEKNELIGTHQSLLHPKELLDESKSEFFRLIQESLTNNLNIALEFSVVNSEDKIIPVEIVSQMIYQNEKQIVMGTFRDITERKRAKDELIKQKHFFEQMFMQSFVSTEILDKDGWCERINPKLSEIFGVNAHDMEGKKYNIFKDQVLIETGIVEKLQKVFNQGETIEWELLFDVGKAAESQNINIKENKQEWYHNWAYPIFDENKQLINVIIQHNNINERKFNEEIINLKNQELAELNAAKDKFFSIIAHDLKSPFSGFMGLSKMMSENINNFTLSELHDISKNIQESAKNLYTLLENLLEWSRMQRGSISFNPENCPLIFVIAQNISICEEIASQKNITINNLVGSNISVFADIPMLNTVIRNLLSNAIKFTPRGGKIEIGASIIAVNDNEIIEVYVKDNGIGIDSKLKNNLFKIDTKVSRQGTEGEPSTGLGLLLCKDFIEKNNGILRVESTENVGSTFFFTLNSK